MEKNFDLWNEDKKQINKKETAFFVNKREVWWCSLGVNVGYEADGKNNQFVRPVLILKNFGNRTCWILPLTSVEKNNRYYFETTITGLETPTTKKSYIVLSQIKLISHKRMIKRMGMIPEKKKKKVKTEILSLLEN